MGIRRIVEVRILAPQAAALDALKQSARKQGMSIENESASGFDAQTKRSFKSPFKQKVDLTVQPLDTDTTLAVVGVNGNDAHGTVDTLIEPLGELVDDRGFKKAKSQLATASKISGIWSLRHLPYLLRGDETIVALGQGQLDKKDVVICLTTRRVLVLRSGITGVRVDQSEYPLVDIQAVSTDRGWTGETLVITTSNAKTEITKLWPGQAEELTRQIQSLKTGTLSWSPPPAPVPAVPAAEDPADMLKKLADLHDQGILTDDEFADKKKALLDKIG